MDGTRDRPPAKTAENWSRRDGIRAGSVSGPWRSGPRDEAQREHYPVGDGPARHPGALPHRVANPGAAQARARARRSAMAVLAVAFGTLVAAGAVILALVFRPELAPGPDDFASDAAAVPAAEPALPEAPPAASADAAATADPALAAVSGVRLRIGPEFPDARRQAIVAALEAAGIAEVQVEPLPFRIASSRVGYYRAEDLPLAEALVRLISPVLAQGEIGVRDYARLLPDAVPGRLDLWVGS